MVRLAKKRKSSSAILRAKKLHRSDNAQLRYLGTRLSSFKEREELKDVTIVVGDHYFDCHKVVLALASPYFEAMFRKQWKEQKQRIVNIKDVSPETFRVIYDYIYDSTIDVEAHDLRGVLQAANFFLIDPLVNLCSTILSRYLDDDLSLELYDFALTAGIDCLKRQTLRYIIRQFQNILTKPRFLTLKFEALAEILKDEHLSISDENSIFSAIKNWVDENPDTREKYFCDLLTTINLAFCSADFLEGKIMSDPHVKSCSKCLDVLKITQEQMNSFQPGSTYKELVPRKSFPYEKKLIVVCGDKCQDSENRNHVIVFESSMWMSVTQLPNPAGKSKYTKGLNSCVVQNGYKTEMYVAPSDPSKGLWKLDLLTQVWEKIPGPMEGKLNPTIVSAASSIYLFRGSLRRTSGATTLERYCTRTKEWSKCRESILCVRYPSIVASDQKIFVCGGKMNGNIGMFVKFVQVYDIKTNKWSQTAPLPIGPNRTMTASVFNRTLYVLVNESFEMFQYDMDNNTWIQKASSHFGHFKMKPTVVGRTIHYYGGYWGLEGGVHGCAEMYDVDKNVWTTLPVVRSLDKPDANHALHTAWLPKSMILTGAHIRDLTHRVQSTDDFSLSSD